MHRSHLLRSAFLDDLRLYLEERKARQRDSEGRSGQEERQGGRAAPQPAEGEERRGQPSATSQRPPPSLISLEMEADGALALVHRNLPLHCISPPHHLTT